MNFSTVFEINDPLLESVAVDLFRPGPNYFAMTAINSRGAESDLSERATICILDCRSLVREIAQGQISISDEPVVIGGKKSRDQLGKSEMSR